ncbi:MAG: PilZ domain-containing protein, partial [Limnobacter sp.]|nr:PilZ domain-containing protein [Limnobacter sp.]
RSENGGVINGVLTNLSTGGVEVKTSAINGKNLQKGSEIELDFQVHLADRKFLVATQATIMWRQEDDDEVKLGCAFIKLSDAHFGLIHGFVMDQSVHRIESALYMQSERN